MKSLCQVLSALLDDVKRLLPEVQGIDRDRVTINHRVEHEGDSFLAIALPRLCDALDRGLAQGWLDTPLGFSTIRGGKIPRLFSGIFLHVFDEKGVLLPQPSVECIKTLREITRIFKKVDLGTSSSEKLDYAAKVDFVNTDRYVKDHFDDLPQARLELFDAIAESCLGELRGFDKANAPYKHGPGAVAEGLKTNAKWKAIADYDAYLESLGLDVVYFSKYNDIENEVCYSDILTGGSSARLVTVPKSTTARRTITIEPVRRQYVQQGLNAVLRDAISKDWFLKYSITLDDQQPNQRLAELGSRTGEYATLDLKSASDLLSHNLVKRFFRSKPEFLEALEIARTPDVCVGDDTIRIRKYAGMGNATTFPVQSAIFAVIAICAVLESRAESSRSVRRAARSVRVYGDDIIVPTDCTDRAIEWLELFGLRVNKQKSFWTGRFRESCGVDAFAGFNVTPVYLKAHPFQVAARDATAVANVVAVCNSLFERGYYTTSDRIKSYVESVFGPLPYVSPESGSLGWHLRNGGYSVHRWNGSLHRFEHRTIKICTSKRKDRISGWPALIKFFHMSRDRRGDDPVSTDKDHLMQTVVRFSNRLRRGWRPC